MDGGREVAQLEVSVVIRHACAAMIGFACAFAPHVAQAQGRYRVIVGSSESLRGAVVEFRPCVPAEGSDCGARIDGTTDFARDSTRRAPPSAFKGVALWNARDSLVIVRGAVEQRTFGGPSSLLHDRRGDAIAFTLALDAPYAFVLLAGRGSDPGFVVTYDADTRSVIASCALRDRATGVELAPIR
jgi:hypothetical protein